MSIPDLGALGREERLRAPQVLLNPPDEVLSVNDVGVHIERNGMVVLSLRYVVDHVVGMRPDGETATQPVAAKHVHVAIPVDVFVHKLLANGRAITQAALEQLEEYTAALTRPSKSPEPSGEDLAAQRRRAAGDDRA